MFTNRLPIPFVNRFFTLWFKKSSSLHDCLYVYSFLKSDFRQLTVGVPKSLFTITKDVLLIPSATALYLEDTYYQYLWTYIDLFIPADTRASKFNFYKSTNWIFRKKYISTNSAKHKCWQNVLCWNGQTRILFTDSKVRTTY